MTALGEFEYTPPFVGVVDFFGFFFELLESTEFYFEVYFLGEFTNEPELCDGLTNLGPLNEFSDDDFEMCSK